eukprot:g46724.t1
MATLQLPATNLANLANLPPGTKLYLTTNSKNPSGKGKLLLIPQGAILRAAQPAAQQVQGATTGTTGSIQGTVVSGLPQQLGYTSYILKQTPQVDRVVENAFSMLAFIAQTFQYRSLDVMLRLYTMLGTFLVGQPVTQASVKHGPGDLITTLLKIQLCTNILSMLFITNNYNRFGDRFAEHLRSAQKKDPGLPVACHFNAPPCSLANISASGLLQCSSEAQRKLEEQHLI